MTQDLIIFRPEFFLLFGFFVQLGYGTGNQVAPVSEMLTIPQIVEKKILKVSQKTEDQTKFSERPTRGPNHAVTALTLWAILWCRLSCFLLWESPLHAIVQGGTFQKDAYSLSLCILQQTTGTLVQRVAFGWQKIAGISQTEYVYQAMQALMGQYLQIQATDLMSLYLTMEQQSFSLVVLCGLNSKSAYSLEAAIKYFQQSAFRSCLLLQGIGFVYWQTGETNLSHLESLRTRTRSEPSLLQLLGIWQITTGLLWKLAAAPLHFWVPDVYTGAWSSVSLWITVLPKISVLAFWTHHWQRIWERNFGSALAFFRGLSMVVGAIAPLAQTNLKRLLAYSSIGHMGLLLMPLCTKNTIEQNEGYFSRENLCQRTEIVVNSSRNTGIGVQWAYMIVYVVVNLGVWGLLMCEIVRPAFQKYRGPQYLWDLKGLNQSSAAIAMRWAILIVSLAGLPPVYAFLGKAAIIWQSVNKGLLTLVFIAQRYSLVGSVYYLKILKICYIENPTSWTTYGRISSLSAYIIALSVFFMVIGLWYPNILFEFTHTQALKVSGLFFIISFF